MKSESKLRATSHAFQSGMHVTRANNLERITPNGGQFNSDE